MTPSLTPTALAGVRVVDLTDRTCVYATKMLCDLGAEVVRVEPPAGDPMRHVPPLDPRTGDSLFATFMNGNKLSVRIDLDRDVGRALFRRLVASADVVVESRAPGALDALGIGHASFEAEHPELVWTSVTPFGSDGPRAHWQGDDLVLQAIGGLMALSGLPGREPLRLFGEQTCYIAGLHAASATLIALWHRMATGTGQRIDVSVQECIAHTLENAVQGYTSERSVRERAPGRIDAGVGMFECTDGEIFVYGAALMIASSWHNLVRFLIDEEIPGAETLLEARWMEPAWRASPEAREYARGIIGQLTRGRSKHLLYDQLQQRHVLSAPMCEIGDLFDNAQLKFLDWFVGVPAEGGGLVWPGPPFRMSESPRRQPGFAPRAGGDDTLLADLDTGARQ